MQTDQTPDFFAAIAGMRAPDTKIAREAVEFARTCSSTMLFNHVMRSYYLGRIIAGEEKSHDQEIVFVAAVLHDLGLTEVGRGPRRFEIEGADVARRFLAERGFEENRSWLVWDTIALHPWGDINLFKEPEARVTQLGIMADATGMGLDAVEPGALAEILAAFPRAGFKSGFVDLLISEARSKPDTHTVHPVHMIAHHCLYPVPIPDAKAIIEAAPFPE
jgi:HD domain